MLFISILFFISAFALSLAIKNYYAPQKVTKRLTSEIASSITDLDTEIEKVSKHIKDNRISFLEFLDANYKNTFSQKGVEILIFRNDSLKFWTSNVFAAPLILNNENFRGDIVSNGSGYYLVKQRKIGEYSIFAVQLIRYNYKYFNDYLPTGFYKRFSAPHNAGIDLNTGKNEIRNPEGKFLFKLTYDEPFELGLWIQYLIFTLYVTSFLCFISAIFVIYRFLVGKSRRKWLFFLIFVLNVILLRAIQFYTQFTFDLYHIQLFNPAYFASSDLLPSLGDFLINSLLGVQLAFFAIKNASLGQKDSVMPNNYRKYSTGIIFLIIFTLYHFLTVAISGLVLNSSISFRFENILSLPHISHIGVLITASLLLCFLFVLELSGQYFVNWIKSPNLYIIGALSGLIIYGLLSFSTGDFDLVSTLFLLTLFVILYFEVRLKSFWKYRISRILLLVIVLSGLATYIVNKSETLRENEKRKLLATHLSDARDNLAEYYFNEVSKSIKLDTYLAGALISATSDSSLNEVSNYIKEKYFSGYWKKYLVQITICQPGQKLRVNSGEIVTGCDDYFGEKIEKFMKPVSIPNLYFLRQSVDAMYYLGKIVVKTGASRKETGKAIFVEISSNDIWKGLGYPELLIDSKNVKSDNLYGYSYAFYNKGELVKNVGKYSFDAENHDLIRHKSKSGFFSLKGFNHFVYEIDKDTMIVLSAEIPRASDLISPFSYIFLLLMIMLLLINLLKGSAFNWNIGIFTFRLRLQLIMIAVIVVSSVVLLTVSMLFINKINRTKNNDILKEKLNSILINLEMRYSSIPAFDLVPKEELSDMLLNLSNTYFTDINIYNSNGLLLASSRDQIFKEGMISEQISPGSAKKLMADKKTFFIEQESIGSYTFLSAYTPVRNIDNHLLGYLNLPYFAKQEEIRREISGLISAFANIYIIMIVLTIMLALLLSRYITKPLQLIANQFSRIKIGDKNAKIVWNRKDEIGRLVDEYNLMIDKMEKSAELLARSERESAWRQMARQVAHEIKNPLTPIKLSMQLLMRAWNDKAPDWDARLKRFSQTLIMQIDTLSSIATEFSDFAQMPEPQIQQFDVIPLVQQSAALFRDQSHSDIIFKTELHECIIKADPNQILRVFNNLIKNALQAIPADRNGLISISLTLTDESCEISFKDNGTGIPKESQARIFSPNFTTKTGGMGLGLAMVKTIIDNLLGKIWFETNPVEGTTFFVSLPLQD